MGENLYCQGFKTFFNKNIIYIYIYKEFGSGGSFEPPDYNVGLPLPFADTIINTPLRRVTEVPIEVA